MEDAVANRKTVLATLRFVNMFSLPQCWGDIGIAESTYTDIYTLLQRSKYPIVLSINCVMNPVKNEHFQSFHSVHCKKIAMSYARKYV